MRPRKPAGKILRSPVTYLALAAAAVLLFSAWPGGADRKTVGLGQFRGRNTPEAQEP